MAKGFLLLEKCRLSTAVYGPARMLTPEDSVQR
jgi:hypothetical protein